MSIVEVEVGIANWYKAHPDGLATPARVRVARTGQAWAVSVAAQSMKRTVRRPTVAVAVVIDTAVVRQRAGRSARA
jgi:hypothetical protein